MPPDFNRLKVFYFVHKERSVANAAKCLNITPSAVSQSLRKLEEELKTQLFTRLHKRIVPTLAGDQLFEIVSSFVTDLDAGIQSIVQAKQIPSGLLRIGSPIEFGKAHFPRLFSVFRKTYPEVVFSLKLGDPYDVLPMIGQGELDFGLVDIFLFKDRMFGDLSLFSLEPLIEEDVIMACSRRYYNDHIKGDHSFKNLVTKEYISYQKTSLPLQNWFRHHFNRFSVDLNRVMTVDSHQAVITGIKNHLGLGVIAAHIVRRDIIRGRIVPIRTQQKDVINRISLVQLQDKRPTLTEKTFIRFFKEQIAASDQIRRFLDDT